MLLNFQKRMRETTELQAEHYMDALDTAIAELEELKKNFGTPNAFDEDEWVISYGTARLFMTLGLIRSMWDSTTPFRKNNKLTAEICVDMGWAEQQELVEIFNPKRSPR